MTHTIRKIAAAIVLSLLAPLAFAQGAFAPTMFTPFKKGGASIGSGTALTSCTSSILFADAGSLLKCDPAAVVNGSVSTAGRSILTIKDTISGASATSNFLNITGTFPATLSAATSGAYFSTVLDNDAQNQSGIYSVISGASGSAFNAAVRGEVSASGTGAIGVYGNANASITTGIGVWGNRGVLATNSYGGYFSIGAGAYPTGLAALGANNGTAAENIFVAMDNGTAVFTIADGGTITHAGTQADFVSGSCSVNSTGSLVCFNGSKIGFGSAGSSVGASPDAYITREGAAVLQMSVDVNGAPTNQTFKAHDGITGTDVKGASLTLAPGLGTGAAVSNPLTLNRVNTKATGTTAQTYSPAIVACPTKILSNTSATAQTIATITTTSTTGGNVTMDYTTVANNGTLQDTDSGMVKVSWNNNAGTVAATMSAVALQSDQDASGTLATTPTATVATNVVSIKFTPTWVTIVPTTVTGWALFHLATSGDTVVCQ